MQVKTTRCGRHGHPELVFDIGDAPETDGRWLVEFLEEAVAEGERFAAGETVAIGWMVTRVADAGDGLLTLHEPDMESMPIVWIPSVRTTLMHLRVQRAIAESVGLEDELDFPTIRQSAVVCTDVEDAIGLVLSRAKPDGGDSGWFVGCNEPAHDHADPKNLDRTSLYQIALAAPASVGFLALPAGVQVIARPGAAPHLERNGKRLPIKPRSYLAQKIVTPG
jgi:hypothetical protein